MSNFKFGKLAKKRNIIDNTNKTVENFEKYIRV